MKLKFLVLMAAICLIVLAVYSQIKKDDFASAKDFPRDALVYVQVDDLPEVIRLWNDSKIAEKYLQSDNFSDFQNNHLGRKLASRWDEFNVAAGFQIDLETLAGLAERRAAIALYDVGKLEFVFIAPVSNEIFAATRFLQNKHKFAEEILADETVIYRVAVEADRGRQKQELIFTHCENRLIVATSEKLIVQTLANVKGKSPKNSLFEEASFQNLSSKISSHTATVWLNQSALNDDYYFKRYWLMSDMENLKNIRAGMFDIEIQDEKLIERRKFLLNKIRPVAPLNLQQAETLLSVIPAEVPFYELRRAEKNSANEAVQKTIFYRYEPLENLYENNFVEYDDYEGYESSGNDFDEKIDDIEELETVRRELENFDFAKILQSANPQSVLTFGEPKVLSAPLFIDFDRAAVFYLSSPNSFDRGAFETEVARSLLKKTMISAPNVNLKWETKNENSSSWRELKLPMLDWNVCYALQGNRFILTNNAVFLHKILSSEKTDFKYDSKDSFTKISVVDLTQKDKAFTQIFDELEAHSINSNFFGQNIESLIKSISDVKKIEIKQFDSQNISDEEITFHLN
ncbi:MAG: hypothetical protein LUM44_08760 [Pyrinomonadaceae bacterium]|nr:hypothetical protein [Pyrinomonadaceae bacterium]